MHAEQCDWIFLIFDNEEQLLNSASSSFCGEDNAIASGGDTRARTEVSNQSNPAAGDRFQVYPRRSKVRLRVLEENLAEPVLREEEVVNIDGQDYMVEEVFGSEPEESKEVTVAEDEEVNSAEWLIFRSWVRLGHLELWLGQVK